MARPAEDSASSADGPAAALHQEAWHRPDIDGLRGFGALLVLWFHFRETWSRSAYKGADITNSTFFAVSGFVITLSVLRARQRNTSAVTLKWTGGFALLFLLRRLQRLLMPQLFVMVVTVVVFCGVLTPSVRMVEVLATARYAVVGGANLYFGWRDKQDALDYVEEGDSETSLSRNPLMHMWYLGVEEQFYALYPWMFGAAHALGSQLATYAVLGATLATSFVSALGVDSHSGAGFFLLQFRGWEVIVGVIACHVLVYSSHFVDAHPGTTKVEPTRRRALLWPQLAFVGLVALGLRLFLFPEHSRKATLCALAGTVSFFIAGHGHDWKTIHALNLNEVNPREVPLLNYLYGLSGCAYFGRLSYALYLWHFPVQVLCADFKEDIIRATGLSTEAAAFSVQLALLVALSVLTHHFVENPYRWWRPARWYLPALCVLLLAAALEVWLSLLYGRMQDAAVATFIRHHDQVMPPLLGKAELVAFLFAALAPVFYFAFRPFRPRELLLLFTVSVLHQGAVSLKGPASTNVLVNTKAIEGAHAAREVAVSTGPTWSSWSGGIPSFASFGCACRASQSAHSPPDANTDLKLPMCFDLKFWAAAPMPEWKQERKQKQEWRCAGTGLEETLKATANENWINCRIPGRGGASQRTAFVFGSSNSYRLRTAVAYALGGEFAVFGISHDGFTDWELLQLLFVNRSNYTASPGVAQAPRIRFDETAKDTLGNIEMSGNQWAIRQIGRIDYIRRIGAILDQHLGKGDLIFFDWLPPLLYEPECKQRTPCINHKGADLFCCSKDGKAAPAAAQRAGLIRLASLASARRASLVITTGRPEHGSEQPARNRSEAKERMVHEFAASRPSVLYWPIGQPFCKENRTHCRERRPLIPGTRLPVHDMNPVHLTHQAAAFAAPFLCSLLKHTAKRMRLPKPLPQGTVQEFRHHGLRLNMQRMRESGADEYQCRIYNLPARGSVITAAEHIFQPPKHRDIVHHSLLRFCTRCPGEAATVQAGAPFSCRPNEQMPECYPNMIHALGSNSPPLVLPTGVALPIPENAACLLFETHYKAPQLEEPGLTEKELKEKELLRQSKSVFDSSGLRVTFETHEEAAHRGIIFKFVQLLEVGPRILPMLTVPPGRANHKVSSVCPGTCFARAMQVAKVPDLHIMGVAQHAHLAATAVFSEIFNPRTRTSVLFGVVSNHREYRKRGERWMMLREPIRVTADDIVKATCVYNTSGREKKTTLGPSLKDEMCYTYIFISPPVRDFHQCWHIDQSTLPSPAKGCVAQCGAHDPLEFKLPRNSSRWSSQVAQTRGDQAQAQQQQLATLGDKWPGASVCED